MDKIKIDQFLKYKYISGIKENPEKSLMAFAVAKANLEKNKYFFDLFVSDGKKHQKATTMKNTGEFIWENDDCILFPLAKNKTEEKAVKEQYSIYYRYCISTKKLEKAYQFPLSAKIISVIDETKLVLASTLSEKKHELYLADEKKRKEILKQEKKDSLYEEINEIPFYFNGEGFVNNQREQLFIYDIDKKNLNPVVDPNFSVGLIKVSEDKTKIYYTGQLMTGIAKVTDHLFSYHINSEKTKTLYEGNDFSIANLYLTKKRVIVAGSYMDTHGMGQNSDFYTLENGELKLFNKYGYSISNSMGSDVRLGNNNKNIVLKDKVYFVATIDDHSELRSLNSKGDINTEFSFNGSIDGICVINNEWYVVGLYRQKLQEIYNIDVASRKLKQISRFNSLGLKSVYVARPKEILVKLKTHEVKGWVLYPKEYKSGDKYPTILNIHGGPKTIYGKVFYHEMQYWANQGYIVIFANPRGSDGKGDDFADIRGKYGGIDYEDLMAFVDRAIKKIPEIDDENLLVTGGSYGGFMTNWIVGHTNRFKAAVTQRSITNWISFYGTSDIGFNFAKDQSGGHPNEDTEKLWEQSPLKYANNIKTPLLFIHADKDYRCPIEQAMQLYTILKQKGVKTKFVWFKDETHELSRAGKPQARIKRLEEISSWFLEYKA